MEKTALIDVVEAAYAVDSTEERWLRGLVRASKDLLDDGSGVFAFTYDACVPERMTIGSFARSRNHEHFDATTALSGIYAAGGADYIRSTFRSLRVEGTRSTPGFVGSQAEQAFDAMAIGDLLVVNGVDATGVGVCLGAITRQRLSLVRVERERYSRIATHLANGRRLRSRLAANRNARRAPWDADAVLSPRGRVEHAATSEAQLQRSRDALRNAAVAVNRARGKLRRIDVDSALGHWTGLVDGRWSLVNKFDTDGKRYVLARRNEPEVSGLALLTGRERAVVAYAAMGHSNKLIAYNLGVAHSTVRVLLARAASKLGARTRDELVKALRDSANAESKPEGS